MQDSSKNKKNQNLRDIFSSLIESNKKSPPKQQSKQKVLEFKPEQATVSPTEKPKTNNELNIDFSLKGGPLHTDLLVAEAFISSGPREGEPLPLQCKWFTIDESTQMKTEIEKVTGAFYQPSIIDVGFKQYNNDQYLLKRIGIEAIPMTQDEIQPWYAEVGPITQDKAVEAQAQQLINNNEQISFPQKIELISEANNNNEGNENEDNAIKELKKSILELEQPTQIDLIIIRTGITITYGESKKQLFSTEITENYPSIKILKYLNNIYEIVITSNFSLRFITKNPIERDLILLIFNYYQTQTKMSNLNKEQESNEQKVESQQQLPSPSPSPATKQETIDNSFQNFQLFSRIESQTKQISILQQEVTQLRDKILQFKTQKRQLKDQFKQTEDKKIELEKKTQEMISVAEDANDKAQSLLNEKIFYLQEINILKSELKDVNIRLVQYQSEENKIIDVNQPQKLDLQQKQQSQQSQQEFNPEEFEKKIQQQAFLIQDMQELNESLKNKLSKQENEKEELQNELNYQRKLNSSLIQEKNLNKNILRVKYRSYFKGRTFENY